MSSPDDRDQKALSEVKSYLEQTGRKAPESFLTRSKKTYEVLAKLVVSKTRPPGSPNAQSFIRSAADAPVQQTLIEKPTNARNFLFSFCGVVGLAALVAIILVVQKSAEADADFKLAVQAMKANNAQLAVQELNRSEQLGFHEKNLNALRAAAYATMGDYKHAADDFTAVLNMDSNNADALFGRAACSLNLHEYQQAAADCTAALKLNSQPSDALSMRAVAYARSGKYDQSLQDCELVLNSHEKDQAASAGIIGTRALDYFKLGKAADAVKDLDTIIASGVEKNGLRLLRAQCLLQLSRLPEAVDDLTAELKADPDNLPARTLRAKALLQLHRDKDALADFNFVIERAPSPELYIARAGIYMALNEYEPAVDDYDQAMAMKPATADLKAKREEAWQLLKRYRPMVATMKETIRNAAYASSSPPQLREGADKLTAKGYAQYRQGKFDDAIDTLSAAVRANPAAAEPRRFLAYSFMAEGDCVDASQQFQTLLGMNQLNDNDQMQYARALTALGRSEEAIDILKDLVANNPGNSWARMSLIKLYLDAGVTMKAMRLSQEGMRSAGTESERAAYSNIMHATGAGGGSGQ